MKLGRWGYVAFVCLALVGITALLSDPSSNVPSSQINESRTQPSPTSDPSTAHDSDTVQFDFQTANQKQMMNHLEAGTNACFGRAFKALLMQGMRSRNALLRFAESTCGQALNRFLVTSGMSGDMATAYIHKSAEDELDLALREGQ
jgi:hypothetical protein